MFRATDRINRAIVALNGDPNWEAIKEWLRTSYANEAHRHVSDMMSDEGKYRFNQGAAFRLIEFITIIDKAKENIIKK